VLLDILTEKFHDFTRHLPSNAYCNWLPMTVCRCGRLPHHTD